MKPGRSIRSPTVGAISEALISPAREKSVRSCSQVSTSPSLRARATASRSYGISAVMSNACLRTSPPQRCNATGSNEDRRNTLIPQARVAIMSRPRESPGPTAFVERRAGERPLWGVYLSRSGLVACRLSFLSPWLHPDRRGCTARDSLKAKALPAQTALEQHPRWLGQMQNQQKRMNMPAALHRNARIDRLRIKYGTSIGKCLL